MGVLYYRTIDFSITGNPFMKIVYVDGNYIPLDQAVIPVDDLAVLRGYAAWDIIRTYDGKPYFLDDHLDRLRGSAERIGLDLPLTCDEIKAVVLSVLEKNPGTDEANIRVLVTGGSSPDYFTPSGRSRLVVLLTDIPKLPREWYRDGVKVITHKAERAMPDAKVTDYVQAALALKKAKARGGVEAVYVNRHNQALEATTSNLFAYIRDELVTPDHGVLKGITRKTVLALARERMKVSERALSLPDLLTAGEVFITGTNKGVVPVVQIDESVIGDGKPGPVTRELMQALDAQAVKFRQAH